MGINMGASPSEFNYRVALRRSTLASVWILGTGLATLVLAATLPIGVVPRALLALWVGGTLLHAYRVVALRVGPRGVQGFVLRSASIDVGQGDGCWRLGSVSSGSFVARWLTIIRWRPAGGTIDKSIVILSDMLPREEFRALRVRLRWGETSTPTSGATSGGTDTRRAGSP
jgi:hypothetical protein